MDLQEITKKIFGRDYLQGTSSRIVSTNNKKICLIEIREWIEEYLNNLESGSLITTTSSTTETFNSISEEDKRPGRIGGSAVFFSLDRSFGVLAINQEGLNVVAACRFATVAASCALFSGKWMYELHLGSRGIMQIGDTPHSYAYDGSRIKSWNMLSQEYGEIWKAGDVIGLCINLNEFTIEFYRNGRSLGIAYSNISAGSGMSYMPCVSLIEGESVYANFGARPFKYPLPDYEPLQRKPINKIKQAETVLKWLKNLTVLVTPVEPKITKSSDADIVTDKQFWNRLYSILCYYMNTFLFNRYCLFNNFLPFMQEVTGLSDKNDEPNLDVYRRIMDELWIYVKERIMDKMLYYIFTDMINSFKQVSETLNCRNKNQILKTFWILLSHQTTRKFLIKNFLFERVDVFAFLHHKPLDQKALDQLIGEPWWNTNGVVPTIEKNKRSFKSAYDKLGKSYDELEKRQCKIVSFLLTNNDGNDEEPSSRQLFLRKLRKFSWHELECSRNDVNSKVPSSIAYGGFLRLLCSLEELWKIEIGDEPLVFPARYFYDKTFQYSNCDRIGGLEQYLIHTLRPNLVAILGEDHRIFSSDSGRQTTSFPMAELRAIGLAEAVNLLGSNENLMENFLLPTTSNGPVLQAIFAPIIRDTQTDYSCGNVNSKDSLLEVFEDLIMFFMSAVSKHCKKISKAYTNFQQCIVNYNSVYLNYKKMQDTKSTNDLLLSSMKSMAELQKNDLAKRAKKAAWIEYVLLNQKRFQYFSRLYNYLVSTVVAAEEQGDLFVFVPDFYLEACDIFTEVFVKDFLTVKLPSTGPETKTMLTKMADLMVRLIGDYRIKHIDCKKIPTNTLASFASNPSSMKILEALDETRSKDLVEKLMLPYKDRHWKATNWILVRFWHGSGFGFRYSTLPHHNVALDSFSNPVNFSLYNIECAPSEYYQKLVREQLLNSSASIPVLLDTIISELHWTFGEFLAPVQELQRAVERNEQLLMMGRLYKMCSTYFDKTIGLLRVLDMFISLAPEVFLESYYPESTSLTKRIIQVVLLIIHRISTKQGCFRTVMNSRIAVLENVEYFPIESACIAIILDILSPELEKFLEDDLVIPRFSRIVLTDSSYEFDNLSNLIGSPENKNSYVVSLHDYETEMLQTELAQARKMLKMLSYYLPLLSTVKVIPEDELCTICYSAPFDVKFSPCGHHSCFSCISYYIHKNRLCFFCKQTIVKVYRIEDNQVIDELSENPVEVSA